MIDSIANVEMAAAWDGDEGEGWTRDWVRYDRAVAVYEAVLQDVAAIGAGDHVLDVGCGVGETSRAAARAAGAGSVLGVDLSSRMLERAQDLARAEGLGNLEFRRADAQVHRFEPGRFDVVVSRFGAMFFADPRCAFANVAAAMRTDGRLVMTGWRVAADNEWMRSVPGALAIDRPLRTPPVGAPGPLALAEPERTSDVLAAAGFRDIEHRAVDAPFWVGHDATDAFAFLCRTGIVRGMLQGLDEPTRARALDRLRRVVADHDTGRGVEFGSGAWIVTARRAPS